MSRNLANALLAVAFRWPDRVAIDAPEQRLTYREFMGRAGAMARLLEKEGVRPGDRVGIALTRNDEALIAVLGTWILDASALVVDFRTRAGERSTIAEGADVRAFLEDRAAPGKELYPAFKLQPGWESAPGAAAEPIPTPRTAGDAIAVIGVSSGTTGTPQQVALSHECLFARYAITRSSPQWNPGGRFLVTAPLAFSATRKHVLSRLLDGGTVIFAPLLVSPSEIVERALEARANSFLTVPTIVRALMELAPSSGHLFPEMDWLMCCGAPMLPEEKIAARDGLCRGFVQNYGSTMAGMVTLLETADIDAHSESVGRPLAQVLVEIADSEQRALPAGETGQIRVRTPAAGANMDSGGDMPRRDSDLMIDGWIYPGDLGMLDEEGFLHIQGRSSDVIIRAGVNVYPAEVEKVLSSHPGVVEAAVVGWPDKRVGEEVAAFVVAREGVRPEELVGWCRGRLQPDKQPREVFLVPSIPYNANGKLVRRDLIALLPER